jgi:hypothetical protein
MGAITYTAKREIEPTGYVKTGVDISAAPADDSFNASSTTLTGLLADQWLTAAGFASAANNGWFQAKSSSTSGKIITTTPPVTHLRLPAVSGNFASTPDSAANSVTGDITLRVRAAATDWTPGAVQTLIAKWNTTGNQRSYQLAINTDGTLNYSWSADGTAVISKNSTVATGIADLASKYLKVTHDVDNGAAGNDVKFWLSDDGVNYTQLGATVTTAGTTSIFNGTAALEVGSIDSGTAQLFNGRVFSADVAAGIDGAAVASFDASLATRGAATFAAATGETWTINQSGTPPAELQGRALVTAAAGPVVTLTGYKRGLGQSYSLEPQFEQAERSVKMKRNEVQPLADVPPEVLLHRRETHFEMLTDILTEAELPQWREFLASVAAGESFTLDRYGTLAAPVEARQAVLASDDYSEKRLGGQLYRIAFSARVF